MRDALVESKIELKAAVESMKGDLMKEFASIPKTQAEEHSKALAQVQVTKTETRPAGSRRAAGVYSGQGSNAAVTALAVDDWSVCLPDDSLLTMGAGLSYDRAHHPRF
jgi:hypothetical protein